MQLPKRKLLALIVYVSGLSLSLVGYANASINLSKEHIAMIANSSNVVRGQSFPLFYGALATAVIFAAIPGTLIAPWFMNRFGRKFVLCFIHAPLNVLASGAMIIAKYVKSYELLLIGRAFVGLSIGFAFPPVVVYATECSPGKFRAFLGSMPIIMIAIGTLFSTVINAPFSFGTATLWMFGQSAPPLLLSLILICSYPWLPESPKYSLQIGDIEGAKHMISKYHGAEAAEESLSEMRCELVNTKVKWMGFWGAFKDRATRRAIFLGFVANTTVGTSGLVTLHVYSKTALAIPGIEGDNIIAIVIGLQVLVVIATAIAALVIHKLNRRTALLGSIFLCAALVGVTSAVAFVQKSYNWKYLGITEVVLKAVVFVVAPTGHGIPIVLPSELSTTADRPLVSSLSLLGQYIAEVVAVILFPFLSEKIGSGYTYVSLSAAPLMLAGIYLCLKMPETKGRRVEDIVKQLAEKKVNELSSIDDKLGPGSDKRYSGVNKSGEEHSNERVSRNA